MLNSIVNLKIKKFLINGSEFTLMAAIDYNGPQYSGHELSKI